MRKPVDPTLRQAALEAANRSYREALGSLPAVPIELVPGHDPDPDIIRYWCVQVSTGLYRACIVYDYPGRGSAMFIGQDGGRPDVLHWLSKNGVPAVRLGQVIRK